MVYTEHKKIYMENKVTLYYYITFVFWKFEFLLNNIS